MREPRVQIMKNMRVHVLPKNHSAGSQPAFGLPPHSEKTDVVIGSARQPPRKTVVATIETLSMLMYSERKNHANFIDEYSVVWPATISPSASGRSKGSRFVSPNIEMR